MQNLHLVFTLAKTMKKALLILVFFLQFKSVVLEEGKHCVLTRTIFYKTVINMYKSPSKIFNIRRILENRRSTYHSDLSHYNVLRSRSLPLAQIIENWGSTICRRAFIDYLYWSHFNTVCRKHCRRIFRKRTLSSSS